LVAGGLIWLTTVQFFVVQAAAQQAWKGSRPFSLAHSWISDLGATSCGSYAGGGGTLVCSPRHVLVNVGFVVLGAQIIAGAALLRPVLPDIRSSRAALVLLIVAGAALPFVAGFPEDTGRPWHAVAATIHLAAAGLGTLAAGFALRSSGRRWSAGLTLLLGGASLLGTVLTVAGAGAGVGRAAVERLAAWPFTAWTCIAGGLVLVGSIARPAGTGLARTGAPTRAKRSADAECAGDQ
jgi:hypothetical membrane protein